MALTKEQVFTAADQIAAVGQRPTLEAVRQITGGSFTTISPALNEWKAKQASAAVPMRDPAPQAVADRLAEVGAEVWAIALGLANARLAADREAIEKTRAGMEAAQAEATDLADRLTAQVEELQARLAASIDAELVVRIERDQAREAVSAAREDAAKLRGQVETLQAQFSELVSVLKPNQS